MSSFKFTYFPQPQKDIATGKLIEVFRPFVPIFILKNGKNSLPFQALVDSGADRNLFPAEMGEFIGLQIKSGVYRPVFGIGDIKLDTYTHEVEMHIGKCSFLTEVDFSYEQEIPLLGRDGFFNEFKKISFNQGKKEIFFKK